MNCKKTSKSVSIAVSFPVIAQSNLHRDTFIWHQELWDFRLYWWIYQLLKFWPKLYLPDCRYYRFKLQTQCFRQIGQNRYNEHTGWFVWFCIRNRADVSLFLDLWVPLRLPLLSWQNFWARQSLNPPNFIHFYPEKTKNKGKMQ